MYRLCFILCILFEGAASDNCLEKNLSDDVRKKLKNRLKKVNAEYVCEIEYELADDIALYAMGHPKYDKEMKQLVKFVKSFERFFFKVRRFKSQNALFKKIRRLARNRKIGCVHVRPNLQKYICLIEKESFYLKRFYKS